MVENVGNLQDTFAEDYQPMQATICLGEKGKKAKFYVRGKKVRRKLVNGTFREKLDVGDAIFIEIKD
jgi:hypothetical protein